MYNIQEYFRDTDIKYINQNALYLIISYFLLLPRELTYEILDIWTNSLLSTPLPLVVGKLALGSLLSISLPLNWSPHFAFRE